MTKTFTQNDVIRYLYQELPAHEKQWISVLIETDKEFRKLYEEMRLAKELLERVQLEPSEQIVDKIMAFSRTYTACQV